MNMRKVIAGVAAVSILALGVSAASAQFGRLGRPAGDMGDVLALIEEQTGLTAREIMAELRSGGTLAELISANGGDVDAVIAAAVEAATAHINAAVEAGRITQERADALLAQVESTVTDAINGEYGIGLGLGMGMGFDIGGLRDRMLDRMGRMGPGRQGPNSRGGMLSGSFIGQGVSADIIRLAAEQTGLEVSDILGQLFDGGNLGDILRDNGVDVEAFVDAAVSQAEETMGLQMQSRLDNLRERLLDLLSAEQAL